MLHGLTGSSSSLYVLGLQQRLAEQGWASVAINWRGCSGEPNLLPRGYHSGASEDLAATVEHLRRTRPLAPLHAVGYSLGGNVLLKYLGESGEACPLQGAVAVSVPFRLDQCADRIGLGFSRVYQRHFMREMVAYVRDKQRLFAHQGMADRLSVLEQLGPLDGLRTFWDFDGRITAPLHGYADADDYYRRASSRFFLGAIRVPTLLIQSADDPFVFRHSVPEAHELSASTRLELHDKGGMWASSAARRASPTTTWNAHPRLAGRAAALTGLRLANVSPAAAPPAPAARTTGPGAPPRPPGSPR